MNARAPLSTLAYVAGPQATAAEAGSRSRAQGWAPPSRLRRRGVAFGWVSRRSVPPSPPPAVLRAAWEAARPTVLPACVQPGRPAYARHIQQALQFHARIAAGEDPGAVLAHAPYADRLAAGYEMLTATQDESDPQEIETLEFDAVADGQVIAENLWCKVSWLSFSRQDASLRFRFSFGLAGYEDVAADLTRQHQAAALTEAVFPESALLSGDAALRSRLRRALGVEEIAYVERIVYFNAPQGGAQFHQDVERGHLGVVFAQLFGRTAWLALSKTDLLDEIQGFLDDPDATEALTALLRPAARQALTRLAAHRARLSARLDRGPPPALDRLLNRCPAFARRLIERGHGHLLEPGDLLLLAQHDAARCTWHSVFCLDDFTGEALSFALRSIPIGRSLPPGAAPRRPATRRRVS